MDRKYNLKLDLQFRCNNSVMKFRQSDNKTSDFFMRITTGGELFNIDNAIVILAIIKPDKSSQAQFLEVREGKIYADLNANMKDQVGTYKAQALLIYEDERVSTDVIEYEVTEDNILNQLETTVSTTEEFTMLQQMLSRLSVIELSETQRKEAEINRGQAEKLREEAIEKIKSDTTKLITDTKKEISDYKNAKDTAIDNDLKQFKEATNQAIEEYKSNKDTEINNNLKEYKSSTTDDIEEFKNTKSRELDDFKNTKNSEIDNYKKEKDLAINQYVKNKNLELDEYVRDKNKEIDAYKTSKDKEIDLYKENKDTLINNKIKEVESAKQNIVSTANNKISELDQAKTNMQNSVNSKIEEADNRISELQNFETQLEQIENKNIEQDNRLKDIEYKNKVQDVYISGLFNENNDKRLSIEGEGNSLKLEGSKQGLVTVDKVVGDTFVNIGYEKTNVKASQNSNSGYWTIYFNTNDSVSWSNTWFKPNTKYTLVIENMPQTMNKVYLWGRQVPTTNKVTTITTSDSLIAQYVHIYCTDSVENPSYTVEDFQKVNFMLFEGELTEEQIPPEHIEGMQSTFENQLVTQEMVDSGEELEENLGKYKCNMKVRSKNLLDSVYLENKANWVNNKYAYISIPINLRPYTSYTFTCDSISAPTSQVVLNIGTKVWEGSSQELGGIMGNLFNTKTAYNNKTVKSFITTDQTVYYLQYYPGDFKNYENYEVDDQWFTRIAKNIMIEEGTQATTYEPYYERTQTVYLNSPPHKGDEIVELEDGTYHYHKMGKYVLDGSEDEGWASSIITNNNGVNYMANAKLLKNGIKGRKALCDKLCVIYGNQQSLTGLNQIAIHNIAEYSRYFYISTNKDTVEEFKAGLQANPVTLVYELKEPYFEKISDDKLLLEIPNNATLSVESVIPCTSISASYTSSVPNLYGMEDDITTLQDTSVDIIATSWDTDYRLSEVEWALEDSGILAPMLVNINTKNIKGGNTMALTKFEQAKIMIIGGAYNRATLTKQLSRYLEKGVITQSEYDELIALMDAKELVTGE